MIVLRCTAKMRSAFRCPPHPDEPPAGSNPLGEWYADVERWKSRRLVVMLNGETGVVLVLPGTVRSLRGLAEAAEAQFLELCARCGVDSPLVQEEARHLGMGFMCAPTRSRSLVGSLQLRKYEAQLGLETKDRAISDVAQTFWNGLFLPPGAAKGLRYRRPVELLSQRFAEISAVDDSSFSGD